MENIGKGCQCIYPAHQRYVIMALAELINQEEKHLKSIKEEEERFGIGKGSVIPKLKETLEWGIDELKRTKDTFATMQVCTQEDVREAIAQEEREREAAREALYTWIRKQVTR